MSAILEISDTELAILETDCAFEIVTRIEQGEFDDFWSEHAGDIDLHLDVQEAFREMSGKRGKPDPHVALGVIQRAITKAAAAYAKAYVDRCDDVQELAQTLGVSNG